MPPTNDFVDDAMDSLDRDTGLRYLLIVARPGSAQTDCYTNTKTDEGLEFLRRRAVLHVERLLKGPKQ